jgi:hypothetical protein
MARRPSPPRSPFPAQFEACACADCKGLLPPSRQHPYLQYTYKSNAHKCILYCIYCISIYGSLHLLYDALESKRCGGGGVCRTRDTYQPRVSLRSISLLIVSTAEGCFFTFISVVAGHWLRPSDDICFRRLPDTRCCGNQQGLIECLVNVVGNGGCVYMRGTDSCGVCGSSFIKTCSRAIMAACSCSTSSKVRCTNTAASAGGDDDDDDARPEFTMVGKKELLLMCVQFSY